MTDNVALISTTDPRALIDSANAPAELLELKAQIGAVESYLRETHATIADQRRATVLRIRCELKLGDWLIATFPHGGDRRSSRGSLDLKWRDVGITEYQAMFWRTMAAVPLPEREAYLARDPGHDGLGELTSTDLYRMGRKILRPAPDLPAAFPTGRYGVLLIDPPWRYEYVATENRAIENHYPTMDLDAIKALPIADIAAEDAMLFLWATNPKLAEALAVVEAWGFEYRTNLVWTKNLIGMGYYVREQHELLLIARFGEPDVPAVDRRPPSVLNAPRLRHSAKPEAVYGLIEAMYPEVPRIELFAREKRDGWDRWGAEAPQ